MSANEICILNLPILSQGRVHINGWATGTITSVNFDRTRQFNPSVPCVCYTVITAVALHTFCMQKICRILCEDGALLFKQWIIFFMKDIVS